MSELFEDHGIEITLKDEKDFLKIRETLTRVGVASTKEGTLTQSCHILHKRGHYAILHFKEMFLLDGKDETTAIAEEDYARRNAIVKMLSNWNLFDVIEADKVKSPKPSMEKVTVIPYKEKDDWVLIQKYTIGKKAKRSAE